MLKRLWSLVADNVGTARFFDRYRIEDLDRQQCKHK